LIHEDARKWFIVELGLECFRASS